MCYTVYSSRLARLARITPQASQLPFHFLVYHNTIYLNSTYANKRPSNKVCLRFIWVSGCFRFNSWTFVFTLRISSARSVIPAISCFSNKFTCSKNNVRITDCMQSFHCIHKNSYFYIFLSFIYQELSN